jgi:hypothetical protein
VGAIHNSIPTKLANDLRVKYGFTVFVETGLAQGTSALWAEHFFENVISVEISAEAVYNFKVAHDESAVKIVMGDSGQEMVGIVSGLPVPALFWLDGHTDDYTPILAELAAINTSTLRHVIMIDDWRMFGTCPAWPSRERVLEFAANDGARACAEIDDVLVVTPC